MAVIQLVGGVAMVAMGVGGLLNYFGNRSQHAWYVSLVAFVGWFLPFFIVFLVPLDLSSTLYRNCIDPEDCNEPFAYVSEEALKAAWRTIYWCSFSLTWMLIPLLQSYTQSGQFTVLKKLRNAVVDNILYQMIGATIGLIGLIYVKISTPDEDLRAYVMALSNSWGLVLVIIFLGHGMVDVPRRLWHRGDNARELRRISFKASSVKDKCQEAEDEVLNVAKELSTVCQRIQQSDPLRHHVDKMIEVFPAVRGIQFTSRTSSPVQGTIAPEPPTSFTSRLGISNGRKQSIGSAAVPVLMTEKYLAGLNARIKRALRMKDRWTAIWQNLLREGFLAQDIQENADNPDKKFRSSLRPVGVKQKDWILSLEWQWYLKLRPAFLRTGAVFCGLLSLVIVWSELSKDSPKLISVVAVLLQLAKDRMSYGAIEMLSFFTMLYMSTCAYTSLMKIKFLNNYVLVPNHHTDEPTLLFIGSYLCRLTFPLVYNFLAIGKETGNVDTTVFAGYMGRTDMVPFLGKLNDYMPYLILIPTLITLFNVFAKMLAIFSISDTFFDDDDDEGGIGGDLEEGQQVLQDARREEENRLYPRQGVNRDFASRRGAALEAYNKNKRNRSSRDIGASPYSLGEGSSAGAWRDVLQNSGGIRPLGDRYYDNESDDEEILNEEDDDAFDESRGVGGGGGIDPVASRTGRNSFQEDHGPIRSLWNKITGAKQGIALAGSSQSPTATPKSAISAAARRSRQGLGAGGDALSRPLIGRSSLESYEGGSGRQSPISFSGNAGFLDRPSSPRHLNEIGGNGGGGNGHGGGGGRSGPALMFAAVQQGPQRPQSPLNQPPHSSSSLLNPRSAATGNQSIPARSRSPPPSISPAASSPSMPSAFGGSGTNSNRNSGSFNPPTSSKSKSNTTRPGTRVFGSSPAAVPSSGNNNNRRSSGYNNNKPSKANSPIVNIFDDDDDDNL